MNMSNRAFSPAVVEESKFVEVLTSELTGDVMGYRIGGSRPGPNAVLAAEARLSEALFERFIALPTLPWIWGRLYLVALEPIEGEGLHALRRCLPDVPLDGVVMLPYCARGGGHLRSVESGYWTGLRLCRQLGMIEGRGVR